VVDTAGAALLAASTLHLGFQLTVTVLVYPALARVPADDWPAAHDAHSRSIVPLVVLTYAALLTTLGWSLATTPRSAWLLLAVLGTVITFGTTALAAAPTHARLGREGRTDGAIRFLLRADRVRAAGALVTVAGAILALG
jgi:hypothetical protein